MRIAVIVPLILAASIACAWGLILEEGEAPAPRFAVVDVYIDAANAALAAYQVEILTTQGTVKIVGIEGGEHAAFKEPPYYDPAALAKDRVILAAFSTGKDLPSGKTRVATVHVMVTGDATPRYEAKLIVAASTDGKKIKASGTVVEGEKE